MSVPASGGSVGRGPVAVGRIVVIGRVLDHAVQRNVFDECERSHLSLRSALGVRSGGASFSKQCVELRHCRAQPLFHARCTLLHCFNA